MTLPVSSYEELLARVRSLTHETIQLQRELTTPLTDHNDNGEYWRGTSGHSPPTTTRFRFFSATSFTETADSSAIAGKAVSCNFVFGHELENSGFPRLKNVLTPSSIVAAHPHTCKLKYIYVIRSVWQLVHVRVCAVLWASSCGHSGTPRCDVGTAATAEGRIVRRCGLTLRYTSV